MDNNLTEWTKDLFSLETTLYVYRPTGFYVNSTFEIIAKEFISSFQELIKVKLLAESYIMSDFYSVGAKIRIEGSYTLDNILQLIEINNGKAYMLSSNIIKIYVSDINPIVDIDTPGTISLTRNMDDFCIVYDRTDHKFYRHEESKVY